MPNGNPNPCEPEDPNAPDAGTGDCFTGTVTITYTASGCSAHNVGVWIAAMQRLTTIENPTDWGSGD
jgi:hypothetical protein